MMLPRLALIAFLAVVPAAAQAADTFVAGTEDVPLMPALRPVEGSALVFDKPEGRIIEAQAKGAVDRGKVRGFYAGALPQLGWRAAGADAWERDGERLRLDFHGRDGDLTVGFTLSPQ